MKRFKVAGLSIEYETRFPSEMEKLLAGYSVIGQEEEVPILTLNPGLWVREIFDRTGQKPEMVEFYALSASLGDILPGFGRLQTHGVAISYDRKSYIFSAPSGVGKSTRAFLWQKYLGNDKVIVINGDKPILWFKDDIVFACGSPWPGKEGLQKNICVPLGGICILRRSSENRITRATREEFFDSYLSQVQMPKDAQTMMDALSLIEELYLKVPVYVLSNDMSEQGVKVSFEALTGKDYEKNKI